MKPVLALLEKIGRVAEDATLVILLGSMVVMAVTQIVLRQVFDDTISWADEFIKIVVLWLAMVGSIAAARDNRHIRIDVLSHVLPDRLVVLSRIVVDLFAASVCAMIAWQAWRYLQIEIEWQETVLGDVPAWIVHAVVPAAFLLISYRFLVAMARDAYTMFHGGLPEDAS
ncbi:MAG: TRAP transporter small permease [Gammaproteobacteria bacterium]|nr:TRAP transporter small permease [Gammaproteobacteria bacterium]